MTAREKWIAYVTIVLKEIARFMRIWQQTLIPPAISTLLYFVIFGNLIGKRIGQMDGFDYMDFQRLRHPFGHQRRLGDVAIAHETGAQALSPRLYFRR